MHNSEAETFSFDLPTARDPGNRPYQLEAIATTCSSGTCPTVYRSGRQGTVVVQGYAVTAASAGIDVPAGELLVEIPVHLLVEAARSQE